MDAITQEVQRDLRQVIKEAQVRMKEERRDALAKVETAITEAVARIDWKTRAGVDLQEANLTRVCRYRGPHSGPHFLHRQTVALIRIEGAEKPLYLGADGKIYRSGSLHQGFYLAEIDKRSEPQHILRIAKLLDAMQ